MGRFFACCRVLALVGLALGLTLGQGRAEGPPTPAEPEGDEAERKRLAGMHFGEANALFDKELYMAAVDAYTRSYEAYPLPITLYNMAKCYERLGAWDDCVSGYDKYLAEYAKANQGQEPKDVRDVRASIDKCRIQTYPEVTFESLPVGANIWLLDLRALAVERPGLDPEAYDLEKLIKEQELPALGQAPLTVRWAPGLYTLFVRKDSNDEKERYKTYRMEIHIRGGEKQYFSVPLERYRREGVIRIKSNVRKASIFIDGKNIGLTPYDGDYRLEEGSHQVTIDKDEYLSVSHDLDVQDGQQYTVDAALWLRHPPATWRNGLGWAALVIGAVSIGGGGVSSFFADQHFEGTPQFKVSAAFEKVGFIAGGVLVAAGVALLILEGADKQFVKDEDLLDPSTKEATRTTLAPVLDLGPKGGTAGVRVGF
jgi:hypothetical protein